MVSPTVFLDGISNGFFIRLKLKQILSIYIQLTLEQTHCRMCSLFANEM